MKNSTVPLRSEVAKSDQWNLSTLFTSDADWNASLKAITAAKDRVLTYKAAFAAPDKLTAETTLGCLQAVEAASRISEKTSHYAFLMKSVDESDPKNIERVSLAMMADTELSSETSWFIPALLNIPEQTIRSWLDPAGKTGAAFAPYKVFIEKLIRLKAHTLSEKEEKILSLLAESQDVERRSFSTLTNVDFRFGSIETPDGAKELTQSSYSQFLINPDRNIRKQAYMQFYGTFDTYKNTIASLYTGQVQQNIALARIRGYGSAREQALYPDKVPTEVYDNLISTIRKNFFEFQSRYAGRAKRSLHQKSE